jgi:hypothetical protein
VQHAVSNAIHSTASPPSDPIEQENNEDSLSSNLDQTDRIHTDDVDTQVDVINIDEANDATSSSMGDGTHVDDQSTKITTVSKVNVASIVHCLRVFLSQLKISQSI